MLNFFVSDLVTTTLERVRDAGLDSPAAVRAQGSPTVDFSAAARGLHLDLKRLLRARLYEHPRVQDTAERSQRIVRALFEAYVADPSQLAVPEGDARAIADYIAGMTDRYAIAEHARLCGVVP
jgi:dGTPase